MQLVRGSFWDSWKLWAFVYHLLHGPCCNMVRNLRQPLVRGKVRFVKFICAKPEKDGGWDETEGNGGLDESLCEFQEVVQILRQWYEDAGERSPICVFDEVAQQQHIKITHAKKLSDRRRSLAAVNVICWRALVLMYADCRKILRSLPGDCLCLYSLFKIIITKTDLKR